jgi:acyl-CoA synthetase (NDP forming)
VDVTGYVLIKRDLLRNALTAAHDDPGLDALVLVSDLPRTAPPDPAAVIELYRQSSEVLRRSPKPVIVMGNTLTDITAFGRDVASQTGYPGVLGGIHHGLTALGQAVRWSGLHRAALRAASEPAAVPEPRAEPELALPGVRGASPGVALPDQVDSSWPEHRAAGFLAAHGIPVVPSALVTGPEQAVRSAEALGYPVVVKLAADGIEHKSDIGGVRVGLGNAGEVLAAYADVVSAGFDAGADVRGALVQPQRTGGIELLIAIVTDPAWGKVLAVGLGGVWVEIYRLDALEINPLLVKGSQVEALERSSRGGRAPGNGMVRSRAGALRARTPRSRSRQHLRPS